MRATFLQILSLAALATQLAVAAPALVTVVAPFGGDSTTVLSAEVLGVDSDGRTTYALAQNAMQGSSVLVSATGTLVEGSDHVSYTYALAGDGLTINVGADCALTGGNALCGVAGQTVTVSSLGSWVLDVASTASPSASTASPSGSSASPSGSKTSPSGSSSTPTAGASSSAPTSAPTTQPNSSRRTSTSLLGVLAGMSLVYIWV
ncbi:hypothetical protein DFH09DRAFT_1288257 [Mycena vulgaris]|nr:hypothetical protein DFH09DRAFT_1288257 [Mycena vulgaris]